MFCRVTRSLADSKRKKCPPLLARTCTREVGPRSVRGRHKGFFFRMPFQDECSRSLGTFKAWVVPLIDESCIACNSVVIVVERETRVLIQPKTWFTSPCLRSSSPCPLLLYRLNKTDIPQLISLFWCVSERNPHIHQ